MSTDHLYMSRALQLARKGSYTTHPNPRVGCVLVKEGKVVGEGWHQYAGGSHAEVNALTEAGALATGSDCYVTLEPCSHTGRTPPCSDALIRAKPARVIVGMIDPNPKVAGKGIKLLEDAGIKVEAGLMQEEAGKLNPGFIKRITEGQPYIRCKLAMSLDSRTAMANGESKWITGTEARMDVQGLRAQSSAVMTGIGTVLADDPQLNVRDISGFDRQPLRIIIDRELRCPASARIFQSPGRTLIFTNKEKTGRKALEQAGAEVIVLASNDKNFLGEVVNYLANREECNEILLESGAKLAGSLLQQGLIDELIIYQAPVLLGDNAKGLFHLPFIQSMSDSIKLNIIDRRMVGSDLRINAKILK